jgi:hypothetical protein
MSNSSLNLRLAILKVYGLARARWDIPTFAPMPALSAQPQGTLAAILDFHFGPIAIWLSYLNHSG